MDERLTLENGALSASRDAGIGMLIFRNTLAKELDLNLSESLCLTYLGVRGRLSPSELSRLIGLKTGSTTTMLDRLERMGYIERRPSADDRRKVIVTLTERFRHESSARVRNVQTAHRALVGEYSDGELRTITRFLRGFARNLAMDSEDVRDFLESMAE